MKLLVLSPVLLGLISVGVFAQNSQRGGTQIHGNTEINVRAENMTAVAIGENNVVKNRVGVVQESKRGNTKITADVKSVTNVATGRNRKSCVNIGSIVSDECK